MQKSPYTQENVKKGLVHYFLGRGASGLAGFLVIILLVRYMDIANYASFTALSGLTAFCGILVSLGMERAISRFVPEGRIHHSPRQLNHFITVITLVRLSALIIVSLLILAAWPTIAGIFDITGLTAFPAALFIFIIAESLFQHFSVILQALVLQKSLTRIMVIQWGGRLVILAVLISIKDTITLENALWVMAIPEVSGVLVFMMYVRHYLTVLPDHSAGDAQPWPRWKEVVTLSAHNYGYMLLAAPPQGYFMKMVTAAFLPSALVAAYGFFSSLAERVRQYIPLYLFYNLIEPVMIAKYLEDKDFDKLAYRCQLLYKTNLLVLIPVMAVLVVAGPELIGLLTGGKYPEYNWVLLVVLAQLSIGSHVVLLQLMLNSIGRAELLVKASLVSLVVLFLAAGGVLLLDPNYIICVPLLFSLSCNTYIVARLSAAGYRYSPEWRMLFKLLVGALLAILVTCAGLYFIKNSINAMSVVLFSSALVGLVFCLVIYLLKVFRIEELTLLRSFLKKGNKK